MLNTKYKEIDDEINDIIEQDIDKSLNTEDSIRKAGMQARSQSAAGDSFLMFVRQQQGK